MFHVEHKGPRYSDESRRSARPNSGRLAAGASTVVAGTSVESRHTTGRLIYRGKHALQVIPTPAVSCACADSYTPDRAQRARGAGPPEPPVLQANHLHPAWRFRSVLAHASAPLGDAFALMFHVERQWLHSWGSAGLHVLHVRLQIADPDYGSDRKRATFRRRPCHLDLRQRSRPRGAQKSRDAIYLR